MSRLTTIFQIDTTLCRSWNFHQSTSFPNPMQIYWSRHPVTTGHTCHYSYCCFQMLLTKVQVWHWWWVLYFPCIKSSSIFDSNLINPIWGDWHIWPLTIHLSNGRVALLPANVNWDLSDVQRTGSVSSSELGEPSLHPYWPGLHSCGSTFGEGQWHVFLFLI